ncbi:MULTISPECIES: TadE/TadG family type IV pilus assembly protein [unclassified Bradyrhizobium]|uniref:TadE/TadG family type IV pilus assembly protein n=1 Tax=unclassified Bradyrhizobium TaxID=2631580 RepID=UPI0024795E4A|nr:MULTISPECIES: TadE/TadG family type IV pilus assembly protein [unclassified Bradyrhizobium]WGS22034.1 pilus assembly protein [Bradyrhizobium sp. ISRA463]WGS28993.1 pilus assembly protein [Bradyrhizobium sp. ISRA464]
MKIAGALWRDHRGASALEFGLIAPLFFAFVFGIVEIGLLLWTQAGLQHGVEIAARCATVNTTLCPTNKPDVIATYASQQAFGLNLPASTFTYAAPACGNQVNASYQFQFPQILNMAPLTLTATACFPA